MTQSKIQMGNILRPLVGQSHTTSRIHRHLWNRSKPSDSRKGVYPILWWDTLPFTCGPCHLHHQKQFGTRHRTTEQNIHVHTLHHCIIGVLSYNTCILFQGKYLEQVHRAAKNSSISTIMANMFTEEFESRPPTLSLIFHEYGWSMLMTHLWCIVQNMAISSHNTSTLLTLIYSSLQRAPNQLDPYPFGPFSFTWTWQYTTQFSLQETYPHRPVPALGQPP